MWLAHASRCFWCREPIDFRRVTVDHILPEALLEVPDELERLRDEYALGADFLVNDFENWVPAHADCNSRKSDYLEETPSPALVVIFQEVGRRAARARAIAERSARDVTKSKLLVRVQTAIEKGDLTRSDVEELVKDLPVPAAVTIDEWEVAPSETTFPIGSDNRVDVHEAPRFPGWIRVSFDEQEGLEAALQGQSMGPRHVLACPQVQEVADVVERLRTEGAVTIMGESGSGKSMLAWHAAFEFHKAGWQVYLLTNALAASSDLPASSPRALLIIDDAQALPAVPATAALANARRAILVVSTGSVPGFRSAIKIVPKRCVETIAAALRTRESELLPILRKLDSRIGVRAMDTPITFQIENALRSSEYPWQFMFNLGSGDLRLTRKLASIQARPPLDSILYAIAAYQLVTRDTPCPPGWLMQQTEIGARDYDELTAHLNELSGYIELVRTPKGVATPHPRVAGAIIKANFFGKDAHAHGRRDILWRAFRDPSFSLLGVRWLIDELPDDIRVFYGLRDDITKQLLERCLASNDHGGAGYVLARLASPRAPRSSLVIDALVQNRDTLTRWIETCSRQDAPGVADLINQLINNDRGLAQELIDAVDPATVSARIHTTSPADGYYVGGLLGRLTFGSGDWKRRVVESLDRECVLEQFRACDRADVGAASETIRALAGFDDEFAVELATAISPAIVAAMRENPLDGSIAAREVLWWVLRFGPRFILRSVQPEEKHVAVVASIFESVGAGALAGAFNAAQRRDWFGLDTLAALIREASADLATAVAAQVDVEPMLPTFVEMAAEGEFEIDHVLDALALDERHEPAATVVRRVCAPRGRLGWRAAVIAPDVAVEVLLSGGSVDLPLGGGLPSWDKATAVLGSVYEVDEHAARALLRAHADALSDSFLFRQANGGEGASTFLKCVLQLDRATVIAAMQRMPVAPARSTWQERAKGSPEVRAVLREFIAIARDAGGDVAALADELDLSDDDT